MATMDEAKPRRRPVTYGKASRKPIQAFSSIESDVLPQANSKVGALQARSRAGTHDTSEVATSTEIPSLFDISSSDDDEAYGVSALASRKKRRLTPAKEERHDVPNYDEKPLTTQVPAQADIRPLSYHTRPHHMPSEGQGRAEKKSKTGGKISAVVAKPSVQKAGPIKQKSSLRKSPSPRVATYSQAAKSRKKHVLDAANEAVIEETSAELRPSLYSSPTSEQSSPGASHIEPSLTDIPRAQTRVSNRSSATPSSTRSTPEGTPRQTRLIHDMLAKNNPTASPSRLGLSRLSLQPSDEGHSPRTTRKAENLHPPAINHITSFKTDQSRKRLVDKLGRGREREATPDIEGSSSEDSDIGDDLKGLSHEAPLPMNTEVEIFATSDRAGSPKGRQSSTPMLSKSASESGGPRITYAKQRSYMTGSTLDSMVEEVDMASSQMENLLPSSQTNSFHSSFEARSGFPDAEGDDVSSTSGFKTIHELRQAGGNTRFEDDVRMLFEDIEATSHGSQGQRRTGLLELGSRLIDDVFARQFLDSRLDTRLASCDNSRDVITNSLIACDFAILLAMNQLLQPTTVALMLPRLMELANDLLKETKEFSLLAKDRSSNMSKAGRLALVEFMDTVRQSQIWGDYRPSKLSPRIIALRSVGLAIRRVRELGDLESSTPGSIFEKVVGILATQSIPKGASGFTKDQLLFIELSVGILEPSTVGHVPLDVSHKEFLGKLSNLSNLLSRQPAQDEEEYVHTRNLALRLILNITNNNPPFCEILATSELIGAILHLVVSNFNLISEESGEDGKDMPLDGVILALASLINFAECSVSARRLMLVMHEGSGSFLDGLLQLFIAKQSIATEADSVAQTHPLVAFGYLTVLLCTLSVDEDIRKYVRVQMPAGGFGQLVGRAEDFLSMYRKVEEEDAQDTPQNEGTNQSGFTTRFENIVARLKLAAYGND